MAAVNSTISQADYNSIRNKLVNVMGAGSADYGWGQQDRIRSAAVVEGNSVTINEWGNLRYDIINAYTHINGVAPTTAQVFEGNTIKYNTNFTPDTGTLDVPVKQYDVWADNIVTNRFGVGAGQYATTTPSSPSSSSALWTYQQQCTIDFYWANATQARYFFNSGGLIRVTTSFARRAGVNTAQNIAWESLLSTAGTRPFGGVTPNPGTSPADGTNWYRLTNAFQQWYTISSSSPYGSNNFKLFARCTDVVSNSAGTAAAGQIRCLFTDGYTDPGNTGPQGTYPGDNPNTIDIVDGTLTVSVSLLYPTGVMTPVGTGTFTVTNPTVAIGAVNTP